MRKRTPEEICVRSSRALGNRIYRYAREIVAVFPDVKLLVHTRPANPLMFYHPEEELQEARPKNIRIAANTIH
jgi:hypothetical protein